MKTSIIVILFLFYQNAYCQEYTFDNLYEFEGQSVTAAVMINSQDANYYFTYRKGSETLWGYLVDFKKNIGHNFEVINTGNSVQFNYLRSYKINPDNLTFIDKNIQYEMINEVNDSTKTRSILYKNQVNKKGRKKLKGKIELLFDNSNDVFPARLIGLFGHHFFDHRDLTYLGNRLPTKIIFDYNNGITVTSKLTKKLKLNTLLSISKEQLTYKQ